MCGIAGIIDLDRILSLSERQIRVKEMNNKIIHRGPDGEGSYNDAYCSLAMRRLSIIDLYNGDQPLWNEDRSICVFMNGEIYNFPEIKTELAKKGHIFYTNSDTEVVAHLYEEHGVELATYLKGMFTICLYDLKQGIWHFFRDRFGEKPLFYFKSRKYLSFSSEISSLLCDHNVPRHLNRRALPYYLTNTFVPEPDTLLTGVYTLPPGHRMSFKDGDLNIQQYFEVDYKNDSALGSINECIEFLSPVLENAVRRQMISDVPIGAFLSGGIDSSTVVAHMQEFSSKPVQTFTVRFEDAKYDESLIAREVANYLGTDHNEITIPNHTFSEDMFWKIIDHVGCPFPDSSAIPSYFITEKIRKYVTVALSGDGGDELFAGYPFYSWWGKVNKLRSVPGFIRNIAMQAISHSKTLQKQAHGRQLLRALQANKGTPTEIGARMSILFSPEEVKCLLGEDLSEFRNLSKFPIQADQWSELRKAMYYRLIHDLPLDMLIKVDRMSMANSLEVRAPFLDPDLFDASCKIPDQFLIKNGKGKYIIRELMKKKLPPSVFNHPKSGFSIPLHHYMNKAFATLCDELILQNDVMLELFDKKWLRSFVNRGLRQKMDEMLTVYRVSHQLWSLLQLGGWIKHLNITNSTVSEAADSVRGVV